MESIRENSIKLRRVRSSNIELLRILAMLMIVAHHYVVNSGLIVLRTRQSMKFEITFCC